MTAAELDIVRFFQKIFGAIAPFFEVITNLGDEIALFALIAVVYFGINKRFGETLGFTVLFSNCVNGFVKLAVTRGRPFTHDASLAKESLQTKYADSYSFPSGHSQNAATLYGSFFYKYKNLALRIACVVAIVLVMVSRIVLGVHFLSDVLTGAVLGLLVMFACLKIIERLGEKRYLLYIITGGVFFVAVFAIVLPISFFSKIDPDIAAALGAFCGFCAGVTIENKFIKFSDTDKIYKAVIRVAAALLLMVGLRYGLKALFALIADHFLLDFARYFIMIITLTGAYPLLFKYLKL